MFIERTEPGADALEVYTEDFVDKKVFGDHPVSRQTKWRYTKTRGFPKIRKLGNRRFYLAAEIDRWLAENYRATEVAA